MRSHACVARAQHGPCGPEQELRHTGHAVQASSCPVDRNSQRGLWKPVPIGVGRPWITCQEVMGPGRGGW